MNKGKIALIGITASLMLTGCAVRQNFSGNYEIELTAGDHQNDIDTADNSTAESSPEMIDSLQSYPEALSTAAPEVTSSDNAQTDSSEAILSDPMPATEATRETQSTQPTQSSQSTQLTQSTQSADIPQSAAVTPPPQSTPLAAGTITLEEAESTALGYAGLTSAEVTFTKTKLDHDGHSDKYEIEFETAYYEYEFEISADSGDVISFSKEAKKHTANPSGGSISLEEAKTAALTHSGLTAAEVTFTKTESDHDEYEIEFVTADYEYEYEIAADSGEVLSYSKEALKSPITDPPSGTISVDEAKKAALDHAGLTESDVVFTKIKLYTDDGRMVYKLIFHTDRRHYEYAVDASTGGIIGWDR